MATLGVSAPSQLLLTAVSPTGGSVQPRSANFSEWNIPDPPLALFTLYAHPMGSRPSLLLRISGSDPWLLMFTTSGSLLSLWAFTISELLLLLLMLASSS